MISEIKSKVNIEKMGDENTKTRDRVAELLTQLKRGNSVKKDELDKAVAYHRSLVLELQSYKDIAGFSHAEPQAAAKDNKDLRRELDDLKENYRLMSNELKYYTEKAKNSERTNDNATGNTGHLIKNNEENENIKSQLEKISSDNEKLQKELSDSKNQKEHYRCEFEKYQQEYKKTRKEFEDYRRVHNNPKDNLEKLQLDHNKVVKELEGTKDANRKLQVELEKLRKQENFKAAEFERKGINDNKHDGEKMTQEMGQSKAMEKLKQQIQRLNEENKKLVAQISELRNRLSVMAGHKLTDGNPEIADLSDSFRPTKIAEQFRQLYDDEWTRAFEDLDEKFKKEEEIIDLLASIIKDVDHFCTRAASQQLQNLMHHAKRIIRDPEYQTDTMKTENKWVKSQCAAPMTSAEEDLAEKLLKDFRKSLGIISKTPLLVIFRQVSPLMTQYKLRAATSKGLDDFLEKALFLIWVMKMQDPAMEFVWSKRGDKFDKTMYTHYTKRGDTVTQCIWPAVVLHKSGPLMSKGVVQGN